MCLNWLPACNAQGQTDFIYDEAGVRKIKIANGLGVRGPSLAQANRVSSS